MHPDSSWPQSVKACYPEIGLSELARLYHAIHTRAPQLEVHMEDLFAEYGLRWCERLKITMKMLVRLPQEFQNWTDEKKFAARDLAPLLAVTDLSSLDPLFTALTKLNLSKSQGVRAVELVVELFLIGKPLNDLLPTTDKADEYLSLLERWRRPNALEREEIWKEAVARWPWPAHVKAQWQRFGDQSGLELRLRAASPEDFHKQLQKLLSIHEIWLCKK